MMTVEEWKRKNPPIQRKPITNYDRIINKTPEELADFLYATWKQQDTFSKDVCERCPDTSCQPKCWLDWLKQEAEEGE